MKIIIIISVSIFLFFNDSYSQWLILNSNTTGNLNTVHFISSLTGYAAGDNGLILKTTNGGINWSTLNSGLTNKINSVYFFNSSTGVACSNSGNIILTSNSGAAWNDVSSGVSDNLNSVSFFNNKGIIAGSGGTILLSTSGGSNWSVVKNGFLQVFYGCFMLSESNAYVCGVNAIFQPSVAKSTNGGLNWQYSSFYLNSNEGDLRDVNFISMTEGFAVSNVWNGQGGISYTTNGGANWDTQLFPDFLLGLDFVNSNTGFAVGGEGYILKTTTKGINWIPQTSGILNILKSVDFVDSVNGYAVGDGGIILKTTNGGITLINNFLSELPNEFILHQNYPNPFNPTTKIPYDLPLNGNVKIKVFDINGRLMMTLINEFKKAGRFEVTFNGENFASGIYYYKIESGNYNQTRKMILIR